MEPRRNSISSRGSSSRSASADPDAITTIAPETEENPQSQQEELLSADKNSNNDNSNEEELPKESPLVKYRRRTFWILVFYLPLLILPWVFTCVLAVRRLDGGQYVEQSGLSPKALLNIAGWVSAANVLGSINGVATIPLMSALIAQAAVVHCQRRRLDQKFSLRQTMALADRGWSDITILWTANKTRSSSRFLWLACGFISICAIQQPLQSLFVSYAAVATATCFDEPVHYCGVIGPATLGHDPEPLDMAMLPQNVAVQAVANEIGTFSEHHRDPYMWADNAGNPGSLGGLQNPWSKQTQFYYTKYDLNEKETYFVTALPNGTDTGVLREHAMRLNTTVNCEKIPSSQFPTQCPGVRPLTASFSRPNTIDLKVCVPGEYGRFPWTLSRNRQDITEEIFFNVSTVRTLQVNSVANFTLHCTANTTRGYFELGNWHNDFRYGPLKEKWPAAEELKRNFNDYRGLAADRARPTEQDAYTGDSSLRIPWYAVDKFDTRSLNASGPLMTSAIAIFGNGSWFDTASNATNNTWPSAVSRICNRYTIPFTRLGYAWLDIPGMCSYYSLASGYNTGDRADQYLVDVMNAWTKNWNNTDFANEALTMAAFTANKALLTKTVEATGTWDARPIYTSPGMIVPRPVKSLAATIVVSIIIFVQLCGIAYLTWYIYQMPSWTHALDALAMLRIGAGVRDAGHTVPPMRAVQETDLKELAKIDGVVGAEEAGDAESQSDSTENKLVLGGSGLVPRKIPSKEDEKRKWWMLWKIKPQRRRRSGKSG